MSFTESELHFPELEKLIKQLNQMTQNQLYDAHLRLLNGLSSLLRYDSYYYASGCDCCGGSYDEELSKYGKFVLASDLTEVFKSLVDEEREQPLKNRYQVRYKLATDNLAYDVIVDGDNVTDAVARFTKVRSSVDVRIISVTELFQNTI